MQTVIGSNPIKFKNNLRKDKLRCVLAVSLVVVFNIILTALHNEENHIFVLLTNIISDIAAGVFLTAYMSLKVIPENKYLKLYEREKNYACGTVVSLSDTTERVQGFDCCRVVLTGEFDAVLFLVNNGSIELRLGDKVRIGSTFGVISEVQYE